MHLSLLQPTPDFHAPRDFDPVYSIHELVCNAIAEPGSQAKPPRYLYRFDEAAMKLYVLSQDEPIRPPRQWNMRTTRFAPSFTRGDSLAFRVRVNATCFRQGKRHSIVADALKRTTNGHLRGDVTHETYLEWLNRQGKVHGFRIDSKHFEVIAHRRMQARGRKTRAILFDAGDLAGRLTVTAPDKFEAVLLQGIGRSKAFGCGLLQVQRAR